MAKMIPTRNEVAEEYTWKLSDLFPSDVSWRTEFSHLHETMAQLSFYK